MKRYIVNEKGQVSLGALGLMTSVVFTIVGMIIGLISYVNNKGDANAVDIGSLARETSVNTADISTILDSNKRIEAKVDTLLIDRGYSPTRVVQGAQVSDVTSGGVVTSK